VSFARKPLAPGHRSSDSVVKIVTAFKETTIVTAFKETTIVTAFKETTIVTAFKETTIVTAFKETTIVTAFKETTIVTAFKETTKKNWRVRWRAAPEEETATPARSLMVPMSAERRGVPGESVAKSVWR
jgi:hypothetical protein